MTSSNPGYREAPPKPDVLIVDADPAFAEALRVDLTLLRCEVRVVHTGADAFTAVETVVPRLIYLSVELPDRNGFSVSNRFRKERATSDATVVVLSSDAGAETLAQHAMLRTRADHYFEKPVPLAKLVAIARDLFHR